jgi:hypothetical protein
MKKKGKTSNNVTTKHCRHALIIYSWQLEKKVEENNYFLPNNVVSITSNPCPTCINLLRVFMNGNISSLASQSLRTFSKKK